MHIGIIREAGTAIGDGVAMALAEGLGILALFLAK